MRFPPIVERLKRTQTDETWGPAAGRPPPRAAGACPASAAGPRLMECEMSDDTREALNGVLVVLVFLVTFTIARVLIS